MRQTCQISLKSVKPRPKYGDFSIFQDGSILDFQNSKFSTVGGFKRVEMCRHAKLGRNRRNRCRDMTMFLFSRWRPSAILDLLCGDWTTHEGRLVVFITMQNWVGIDAVLLIICKF